jgi:hypothetical protein
MRQTRDMEEDPELVQQELAEIEIPPPPGPGRRATPKEVAALERSIVDEKSFDGAFGRLIRATATLEEQLDEMLVRLIAVPRSAEFFWKTYLQRRGLSPKADDLKALIHYLEQDQLNDRTSRVVAQIGRVAQRRNELVHQIVSTGLPLTESATQFTLLPRFGSSQTTVSLTADELDQLVHEVETTYLRLISLKQAFARAEADQGVTSDDDAEDP